MYKSRPYDDSVHGLILCFQDSILGPCHLDQQSSISGVPSLLHGIMTQRQCAHDVPLCGRHALRDQNKYPTHL